VAVSLLLHPVLEDHGNAKNENEVDTDNAKGGSEDLVKVPVGER
jgi:microcompartment protein CcmK/EutM